MVMNSIILGIGCILEIYIVYDFFNNYFEFRERFSGLAQQLFISGCVTILLFIINIQGNTYLNLFIVPLLLWTYLNILFKAEFGSKILCLTVALCLCFGCELLYSLLLSGKSDSTSGSGSQMDMTEPLPLFAVKLLTYVLFSVTKQFSNKSKKRISGKIFSRYIIIPLSSIGIMTIAYYSNIDFTKNITMSVLATFCLFLMVMGNITLFYAFMKYSEETYRNIENEITIVKYKADLLHYRQMQQINERHDMFFHNVGEQLRIIKELLRQENSVNVHNMVAGLERELKFNENEIYSSHPILNIVLVEKRQIAEEKGIVFDAFVEPGIKASQIAEIDLIVMLGNLLDNAIRATEQCQDDKKVWVRIFMLNEGLLLIIKVVNPYVGKIRKSISGFISTKIDVGRHGIGLKSVEKAAAKYDGFLECLIEKNTFTSTILLSVK